MRWLSDLRGTLLTSFGIGRATVSAASLTAARTLTAPDKNGTLAIDEDYARILPLPTDDEYVWGFIPEVGWAAIGDAPVVLPFLSDENFLFNDEGSSTSGWSTSNASIASADGWLSVTKTAAVAGAGALKSLPTPITADSDFILYSRLRITQASDNIGVLWVNSPTTPRMFSIWLNSANASTYTAGAVSILAQNNGTLTSGQVTGGSISASTAFEFALQYDSKFKTVSCWIRQSDGRWKLGRRLACTFKQINSLEFTFTSGAPIGTKVECDYVSICKPNIAVIGDSIAEGKTLHSPDFSLSLINDESTWMRHAPIYLGRRNNLIVNKGVGANTSAMTRARIEDVTSIGAKVVFLHASSNDFGASVPYSTRTENIQACVDAISAAGAATVLLNSMYGTQSNPSNPGVRDYYRGWWTDHRMSVSGVAQRVNIMKPLLDANGFMSASLSQSDGIHPNVAGYTEIGGRVTG